MANQEKELQKFVTDPNYRAKVIQNVRNERDGNYHRRINSLRTQKDSLISKRKREIKKIAKNRWESIVDDKLEVNYTETKVKINGFEFLFSDIHGAEPNVKGTYRVVTESEGESKKHGSLGGAVIGGMLAGGFGAVIGGTRLGTTTTNETTTQNQIPIYNHIGVLVNVNGVTMEILLLSKQVEQESSACQKALKKAGDILTALASASATPVVTNPLKVEEEPSVKAYDQEIIMKEKQIQCAIADRPTYELPAMYRTYAQREMSDEEYLAYLASEDELRAEATGKPVGYVPVAKRIFRMVGIVCCWALSVITLIVALALSVALGSYVTGAIYVGAAVSINPLAYKLLKPKLQFLRKWMCALMFVGSLIVGLICLPMSAKLSTEQDTDTEDAGSEVVEYVEYDMFEYNSRGMV